MAFISQLLRPLYPQKTFPRLYWVGGWVILRYGLDVMAKGRIPTPDGSGTPFAHLATSHLLAVLSYCPEGLRKTMKIFKSFICL